MATFVAAKQSVFKLADTGGTVRNLTAYLTAIEGLPGPRDLSDVTALGDEGESFIPGMEIATFSLEGTFDPVATTGPDAILGPLLDHGAVVSFQYGPRGAAVGAVRYTGNCWLYRYTLGARTGGVIPFVADFLVNGTVTRDTFPATVVEGQISVGGGDGCIITIPGGGTFYSDFTAVGKTIATDTYHAWYRFANIQIPPGSTITSAYLIFTSLVTDNPAGGVVRTNIYANDVDDAVAPTTYADYIAKVLTTAFTAWDNIPFWTADVEYQSPDISSVIQEIVDRPGWLAGNALMILWKDDGSDPNVNIPYSVRQPKDYDATPAAAAVLHVEF